MEHIFDEEMLGIYIWIFTELNMFLLIYTIYLNNLVIL